MEVQPTLENTNPELLTLSFSEETLASQPEQLADEYTIILASNDCQYMNNMVPLNDLLLGPTFIIEANEQPLFVNDTQSITFHNIDATGQINDIQKITTDSEKTINGNIDFTIDSNDQFQDIYTNLDKTNLDIQDTPISNNLKDYLDILSDSNIDSTKEFNYSDLTAVQIVDDVAINPIDTNGHFVCDLCLCEFNNWQNYKRHKLDHLNDKPFKCLKCLESFNYNNNYLLHIASHSTENLKCPECQKEFKRKASFKSHLKIHYTEESITCNVCLKLFDNQYRLDIHKEICLQDNSIFDLNNIPEETPVTKFKICKTCEQSFSTLSEYKMHIKEHKKFNSIVKKQSKLKNKHKNSNIIKRFKCNNCEWSFNKSILLNRHMRTHTGEKPFQCSYCSSYFTQQNSLNRHMLKHKGLRPFICEFCEMNFSQKVHLINHVKTCHSVTKEATRIHTCFMCSCVYNNLQALHKHLNSFHKLKMKKMDKRNRKKAPNIDEMEDIDEDMKLINEKWLDEVVLELNNDDDIIKSKLCNDPISTKCDFEINLIENENFDQLEVFNEISNINTSNPIEIDKSSFSPQNDGKLFASKKKRKRSSTNHDTVIKNQEKNLITTAANVNRAISPDINKVTKKIPSRRRKSGDKISNRNAKKNLSEKTEKQSDSSDKAEPKVVYVPNITTDMENITVDVNQNLQKPLEPKVLYVPNITTDLENINVNVNQNLQPKVCQHCGKTFNNNADLKKHVREKKYHKKMCTKNCKLFGDQEKNLITTAANVNQAISPDINKVTNKIPSRRRKSGDKISNRNAKTNLSKKTKKQSDTSDKAEPKVVNVPNITTDLENINVNVNQNLQKPLEPKVLYVPNITTDLENINVNVNQNLQPKVCQHCGKTFKNNADLTKHVREKKYHKKMCTKNCKLFGDQEKNLITTAANVNRAISPDINKVTNKIPSRRRKSGDKISNRNAKTNLSEKTEKQSDTSDKAEPKVVYVPNITTDIENINVDVTKNKQPNLCQHCGKSFKKNADLARHLRVHTGDKPYKCDQKDCNKAFATKSTLEYHKITHSGKMKRAECPQCKGLFATRSSMKIHMRQHTGEKPFNCPICGDAFRTSGHLSIHVMRHERRKRLK